MSRLPGFASDVVSTLSMKPAARVIILDDNQLRARSVALLLADSGISVACVAAPNDADEAVVRYRPDMILLHLGRPATRWTDLCSAAEIGGQPAVEGDEGRAIHLDRQIEPSSRTFSASEFVARMRAARLKSEDTSDPQGAESGGLTIDFDRRRIRAGDSEIRLSPKEFDLLSYLADHPNAVVPHRAILTAIWGRRAVHHPERLWALVTKVRKKIEPDPNAPRYLLSEPWVGYRLAIERPC